MSQLSTINNVLIQLKGTYLIYVDTARGRFSNSTSDKILVGDKRNSRSSSLLCEENTVNAKFFFSSPSAYYQILESEMEYNYSYWASRCAGMLLIKYRW